jgi:hypothetical protein
MGILLGPAGAHLNQHGRLPDDAQRSRSEGFNINYNNMMLPVLQMLRICYGYYWCYLFKRLIAAFQTLF